jgi:hypothetical protein
MQESRLAELVRAKPRMAPAAWLRSLDGRSGQAAAPELQLGISGHLLLSRTEEENVVNQLQRGVLPQLFPDAAGPSVCVLTGLAPGSDLLFTRILTAWLKQSRIAYRVLALLPVPPDTLLDDWQASLNGLGHAVTAAGRREQQLQVELSLAACDAIVDLLPADASAADIAADGFRQQQYRRLAACLSQRADTLVAILRVPNQLRPGGTAEVVDWRRHPGRIPPEFSLGEPRRQPLSSHARRLVVIDPAVGYTGL